MVEDWKTAKGSSPFGKNTVFEDTLLGTVELRYVSHGDSTQIAKYLDEKSPRRFACLVIHHQLVQPQLELNQVEAWKDEFLERACTKFLEDQTYYGESFKRRSGQSFFTDFRDPFATRDEERRQLNKRIMKGIISQYGNHLAQVEQIVRSPAMQMAREAARLIQLYRLPESILAAQNAIQQLASTDLLSAPSLALIPPSSIRHSIQRVVEDGEQTAITLYLRDVDPELERKRRGAWDALRGSGDDRYVQATHSMREVLRQLLDKLAPEEPVKEAVWYKRPAKGNMVTRKMKVRYALAGPATNVSRSSVQLAVSMMDSVDAVYEKLSAEAHKADLSREDGVKACMKLCEDVILLILTNRVQSAA